MNTIAALVIALSLVTTTVVGAAPRRKAVAHRTHDTAWMKTCIHERTGPTGGVGVTEARALCRDDQPEDDVAVAKRQLTAAKAAAKVAKAKERAVKAIETCEQAVVDQCVATAPDDGSASCEDSDLTVAFAVCH